MKEINSLHTVIAFTDCHSEASITESVYQLALKWNQHYALSPTLMGTEHDRGKLLRFVNSARKRQRLGVSAASNFNMFCLPNEAKHELEGYDSDFVFDGARGDLIVNFRSSFCPFLSQGFFRMAREFAQLVTPRYGFGYQRPFHLGPTYFAMGIGKGDVRDEEDNGITGQVPGQMFGYFRHGFLRDIFEWNCISDMHLKRTIEGTTLKQWIAADGNRGTLEPFVADTAVWLTRREQIPTLRDQLKKADIIFDHMKHLQIPAMHYHEQGLRAEVTMQNVATRVFLELGLPTKAKPAPKINADIFTPPPLPPSTPEEGLRAVLEHYGVESEEEVKIIKSLGGGKTKELSADEKRKILRRSSRKK